MQRVGLGDDRAPGGQRRCRVRPGGPEGQREVRGAEHGHEPDAHARAAYFGPGAAGFVRGATGVYGHLEQRALLEDVGEETELAGGTSQLTGEPYRPEGRLLISQLGQRGGGGDGVGHVAQRPHPLGQGDLL